MKLRKQSESIHEKYRDAIISIFRTRDEASISEILKEVIGIDYRDKQYRSALEFVNRVYKEEFSDKEIIAENVRVKKQHQKSVDQNRIQNKSFREYARVENAVEEFAKAISLQNKQFGNELKKVNLKKYSYKGGGIGVIHITDTHCNELISLPNNQYDFQIFSKRLKKHIGESLAYFKYRKVQKVLMAFTGDLMNSDRRLDEMLNASTNRAKAAVLAVHIIKQAILEVRQSYLVDIVSVLGNESRIQKEMSFSSEGISDNYDFTIMAQLKEMFSFAKIGGVNFLSIDQVKQVVKIGEQLWLVGHNLSGFLDNQKNTQSEIGMYSLAGQKIDFIIGGHIHALRLTEISARSGSMAGSNSYNENALGLMGRATHNCYAVQGNERFTQVNDIQDVSGVEGYDVVSELESYNAKSASKITPKQMIVISQPIVI